MYTMTFHLPWLFAIVVSGCVGYAVLRLLKVTIPVVAPVAAALRYELYHTTRSSHRKPRLRIRLPRRSVNEPVLYADELERYDQEFSTQTAEVIEEQWARDKAETLAQTGSLAPLPVDTHELPAITTDSWPKSNIQMYWPGDEAGAADPYRSYDPRRWDRTQVLEHV